MIQSPLFWLTLLISVLVFWQIPQRLRFGFLALVSYVYLASLEPVGVTIVIAWVLLFFYVSPSALAEKRYSALVIYGLVALVLGYLIYQKYLPTIVSLLKLEIAAHAFVAPLGVSYFTFKLIHYAIEVTRGNIKDRTLSKFFCYIFLFPIFTAGPIERFDHFNANIETKWQLHSAVVGLTRISHGLAKLTVLAFVRAARNQFIGTLIPASFVELRAELTTLDSYQVWGFVIFAYIYAYLDFSSYSDIAIGASRLFGITIMENFRFPIVAKNIADFWRRWHMTLANFCQSYVYMPIIGHTRNPYYAVYGTFIAMGLWHGASPSWLMWGLYHASGVSIYLTWSRIKRKLKIRKKNSGPLSYLGIAITSIFVSASYCFSSTGNNGKHSIRVFLKLFGIDVEF